MRGMTTPCTPPWGRGCTSRCSEHDACACLSDLVQTFSRRTLPPPASPRRIRLAVSGGSARGGLQACPAPSLRRRTLVATDARHRFVPNSCSVFAATAAAWCPPALFLARRRCRGGRGRPNQRRGPSPARRRGGPRGGDRGVVLWPAAPGTVFCFKPGNIALANTTTMRQR